MKFTLNCIFRLVVILTFLSCSEKPPLPLPELVSAANPSRVKVLLVGIDGATLSVIKPMLREGSLPEFQRLIDEGVHGVLRSERPLISPAIWTTIATGRSRGAHGIENFTVRKWTKFSSILVNSDHRKVLALWNLPGVFQKTVGFVGWWASWPSEPVSGWIVSDRMVQSSWSEWADGTKKERVTYPPELADELRRFVLDPLDPPLDEINGLVELTEPELEEFMAARKPLFAHWLSVLKFSYCNQRSHEEIAVHLLQDGQPDLTGIFLIANDPISHTFWHYYEPLEFEEGVEPTKAQRLGKTIPNIYRHNDRYLARLSQLIDPDTVVMIVSDHGFQASGELPQTRRPSGAYQWLKDWYRKREDIGIDEDNVAIGQSGRHHDEGVLIASGGPLRKGVELQEPPRIFDIAPTILALLGLPVPEDMEGRVLEEIIEPAFFEKHPVRRIASYEKYIDREVLTSSPLGDDQTKDMLRALGYIK